MSEIWVLVDTAQDKVRNVTYEVLAAASKLKEKYYRPVFIFASVTFVNVNTTQ